MAASFHLQKTNLEVPCLDCDLFLLFLSNPGRFCCYKGLCMFLSCHWFSFNNFFKDPALLLTSCHTDILLYMSIPQLCSCCYQKGKNNSKKPTNPKDRKFPLSPSCCENCDSLSPLLMLTQGITHKICKRLYVEKKTMLQKPKKTMLYI